MRNFLITVGVILALAAMALIGTSLWIGDYVRSDRFRSLIAEATGRAFDAKAAYEPLRWTGSSVYAESANLEGRFGSGLKAITASELRAEVNWRAAFSGVWRVDELTISRLQGEWIPNPIKAAAPTEAPNYSKSPAGLAALLPRRFELGILKIGAASLAFGGIQITDSALTIKPDGSGWLFQGTGGQLRLPWQPELSITNFRAREQGGNYYLTEGNLRLGENGKIVASGESSETGKVQVTWEGVKTADVVTGEWRRRLDGTLSGTASMTFPGPTTGTFRLEDGRLENIPLLATLADFTGNPAFRKMPLQGISGDFTYDKGRLQIRNLTAESKGLLRIEGSATLGQRGELEGRFQLGVTAQTLQWLPGSRERVFTMARDGYVWTELSVGGTVDKPTENLSNRLAVAMGNEVIDQGTGLIRETPGAAVEGVKSVLDILRPFVP